MIQNLLEVSGTQLGRDAQAQLIYQSFKKDPPQINAAISKASGDLAKKAVSVAFQDQRFWVGVRIAKHYSIEDEFAKQVLDIPDSPMEEILNSVEKLPGVPKKREFEGDDERKRNLDSFLETVRTVVAEEILLPKNRNVEGLELLVRANSDHKAFKIVEELNRNRSIDVSEIASLVRISGSDKGYETLIRIVDGHNWTDESKSLKNEHVDLVVSGKKDNRSHRFGKALRLIENYGLPVTKRKEVIDTGIETLTKTLIQGFDERDRKRNQYSEQRWDIWHRGPKIEDPDSNRFRRYDSLGYSRNSNEDLIQLVNLLIGPEKKKITQKLCEICVNRRDHFSGLAFATKLGEYDSAIEFGGWLVRGASGTGWLSRDDQKVVSYMAKNVLPNLDLEQTKTFIRKISFTRDGEVSIQAAKKHNLREWLMQEYVSSKDFYYAGQVAESLEDKTLSQEYYERAGLFEKAAEFSSDPLDKAVLYLKEAKKDVKNNARHRPNYFTLYRQQGLIGLVEKSYELAGEEGRENSRFKDAALSLTNQFISSGLLMEAVLFADYSGINAEDYKENFPVDCLTKAEAKEDYQECYHLARALSNTEVAQAYQALHHAKGHGKNIPETILDFKPKPVDPSNSEGDLWDDIPF